MVELLKEVASAIRDLQTLGFILGDGVTNVVKRDVRGGYTIRVGLRTNPEYTELCKMMFEPIKQKGYVVSPVVFCGRKDRYIEYEIRKSKT